MSFFGEFLSGEKRLKDNLKYVDDYKTELVTDEKGRTRKLTTYVGVWHFIDDEPRPARIKLILIAVLCVLAAAGLALSLFDGCFTRGWLLASAPRFIALFPALYLLMGAIDLPFTLKPMHRDRYVHSFVRILRSSVALVIIQLVSLIAMLIYRIAYSDWRFLREDGTGLAVSAVLIASAIGAVLLLRSVGIEEKPNSAYDEGPIK